MGCPLQGLNLKGLFSLGQRENKKKTRQHDLASIFHVEKISQTQISDREGKSTQSAFHWECPFDDPVLRPGAIVQC